MKDKCCTSSDFVKLGSAICGILLVVIAVFVIFARDSLGLLIPISWAFITFGIVLGAFQYKLQMKK